MGVGDTLNDIGTKGYIIFRHPIQHSGGYNEAVVRPCIPTGWISQRQRQQIQPVLLLYLTQCRPPDVSLVRGRFLVTFDRLGQD